MKNKQKFFSVLTAMAIACQTGISAPWVMAEEKATVSPKVGLVWQNDGTAGWEVGYDFKGNETQKVEISYETENETSYMHFVPSGTVHSDTSYLSTPMTYATLGEDKIKFDEGYTIVTEMMIRTNATDATSGRPRVGYSFPENSSLSNFTYVNDQTLGATDQKQTKYTANLCSEALMEFLNGKVRFGVGTYPGAGYIVSNDKWYKVIIKIDGNHYAKYTVINPEDGSVVAEYSGQRQIKPESGYFENIALYTWMNKLSLTSAYTDIDYIKVYNVPREQADNYADEKWQTPTEKIEISDIKVDGVAIEDANDVMFGKVTFNSSDDVAVKEVYYEKDGEKVVVEDYDFENNTVSFDNMLVANAKYSVVLDLGYMDYPISFNSHFKQDIGLVWQNDGVSGWEVGYDFKGNETQKVEISYETENETTYMHFVPSGTASTGSYLSTPMTYATLGEDKIKFDEGYTIVTEMMIRTNATDATSGRPRVGYSFPENSSLSKFTYVNDQTLGETGQKQTKFKADLCSETLMEFLNGKVRFGVGTYPGAGYIVSNDKWYKVIIKMDGNHYAKYTVINPEDGSVVAEYSGQRQIKPESGYFENIALYTWMQSGKLTSAYTDIDYIKVYNVPSEQADNYADEKWQTAFEETKISDIKIDGIAVEEVTEVTNGTVTFKADGEVKVNSISYRLLTGDADIDVSDYSFENNTITFTNGLVNNAEYTVTLGLGEKLEKKIVFKSEWENSKGLVLNLDGSSNEGWTLGEGITAEMTSGTDEDGTTYTELLPGGTYDNDKNASFIYAELPNGGIRFEDDEAIIIDTRVMASDVDAKGGRMHIKWNIPEKVTSSPVLRYNGEDDLTGVLDISGDMLTGFTTNYKVAHNSLTLVDFLSAGVRVQDGYHDDANVCTGWAEPEYISGTAGNINDKWYRVVMCIKPGYEVDYKLYDENDNLLGERTGVLGWIEQSGFLKNIAIQTAQGNLEYVKVDYLRVYNVDLAEAEKVEFVKNETDDEILITCRVNSYCPEISPVADRMIYIASYNADGRLVSVDSAEINSAETTIKVQKSAEEKIFLWDKAMKPVKGY